MTVLVGVCCVDGVVIGADSIATSAMGPNHLVRLPSNDKIEIINGTLIIAATGAIGLAQRAQHEAKKFLDENALKKPAQTFASDYTRRVRDEFGRTQVLFHPQLGLQFGVLMAAPLDQKPRLIEFGSMDFQPEFRDGKLFFASAGSGQLLADPFLAFVSRVLWKGKMPTVELARFGVYWVLEHTIQYAPSGVGHPIQLATLQQDEKKNWKAEMVPEASLQEIAQHVQDLESRIAIGEIAPAEAKPLPPAPAGGK